MRVEFEGELMQEQRNAWMFLSRKVDVVGQGGER